MTESTINLKTFFESEFRPYSIYDSQRSIANVIDGLKITNRKVLYTCLNSNITSDFKVAQLQSKVAFDTAYMHGEAGIGGVICNMAQDFTGTNNINLLIPEGQFGSRLSSIPAATRYIYTKLNPITRKLFKKEDELILEHHYDDDQKIEPKYYLPILPMILINGSQGIGTGFSSKVLAYNPIDIKQDILNILKNKKRKSLIPYYKGFKGIIEKGENDNQWNIKGDIEINQLSPKSKKQDGKTYSVKITELPVGYYLDDIKKTLNKLKASEIVKDYDDNSTEESFDIDVLLNRKDASLTESNFDKDKLLDLFKLKTKDTENLTLWNTNGKLSVFKSASHIVDYFVDFRLTKYEARRLALINVLKQDILNLEEKIRFIAFYLKNSKVFKDTAKKELIELLLKNDFVNYDKLLSMPIYVLTKDKIEELNQDLSKLKQEQLNLETSNAKDMYIKELEELKL